MNKYNAKITEYNGVKYHSKLEATYAKNLDWRLKAKDIRRWSRQIKIPLAVNGIHICNYFIDFKIIHNDGSLELIETKGMETSTWKLKYKLFKAIFAKEHPGVIITLVKKHQITHF